MTFSSREFHGGIKVPKKAAARSDVLSSLDDVLLDLQKRMAESGYEPNWGSTKISTSEPEYDSSTTIMGTTVIEETYPACFTVSVEGVKRVK